MSLAVVSRYQRPLLIVFFILVAFGISAGLLALFGVPPVAGLWGLLETGFNPSKGLVATLKVASPLIIMGVGLAIPFTAGFLNIGGQGQYIIGAVFATVLGLSFSGSLPSAIVLPLAFVASFAGGAIWAIPPTLMKLKLGINEVITTLMMNFVAVYFLDYLVSGPLEGRQAAAFHTPASDPIPTAYRLPVLFGGTNLTWDLVVAVLLGVVFYYLLRRTRFGYELKTIGARHEVANYAGINIQKDVVLSMVISGGCAGIAGMVEVFGTTNVLLPQVFSDITTSFGYIGIPVALIAFLNPLVIIPSGAFFAGILIGGYGMEQFYDIPIDLVTTIYGLIMFFAVIGVYVDLGKLVKRRKWLT